jgi:hypothetical protein
MKINMDLFKKSPEAIEKKQKRKEIESEIASLAGQRQAWEKSPRNETDWDTPGYIIEGDKKILELKDELRNLK